MSVPAMDIPQDERAVADKISAGQKHFDLWRLGLLGIFLFIITSYPAPTSEQLVFRKNLDAWSEKFLIPQPELRAIDYRDFVKQTWALRSLIEDSVTASRSSSAIRDDCDMGRLYDSLVQTPYRHDPLTIDQLSDYLRRTDRYGNFAAILGGNEDLRKQIARHPALHFWLSDPARLQKALIATDVRGRVLDEVENLRGRFARERELWTLVDKDIPGWRKWSWKTWKSLTNEPFKVWETNVLESSLEDRKADIKAHATSNPTVGEVIDRQRRFMVEVTEEKNLPTIKILEVTLRITTVQLIFLFPYLFLLSSLIMSAWKDVLISNLIHNSPSPITPDLGRGILPPSILRVTYLAVRPVLGDLPGRLRKSSGTELLNIDCRAKVTQWWSSLEMELSPEIFFFFGPQIVGYSLATYVSCKWIYLMGHNRLDVGPLFYILSVLFLLLLAGAVSGLNYRNLKRLGYL